MNTKKHVVTSPIGYSKMAKKKVFSIGNSLSNGLEQTFAAAHHYSGELRMEVIPLHKIEPDPDNPRHLSLTLEEVLHGLSQTDPLYDKKREEMESLQSLCLSILDQGIINPIVVYESNGLYKLVVGERRTLASALAKKSHIQAKILDEKPNPLKIRLLQWIENMERSDLSLKERMDNLEKIVQAFANQNDLNNKEVRITDISLLLGCAKSHAINLKAVLHADEEIKQLIANNQIRNLEKAALLCAIQNPTLRTQAIKEAVHGAPLKHLKNLLKKDREILHCAQDKADERDEVLDLKKHSKTIDLGSTTNIKVAQIILESLFKNEELSDLISSFQPVDFQEDPYLIVQTLKNVIRKLESIY